MYFAIEELANWVNKSGQIQIVCQKTGEPFRFENKKELAVFRIVQELLNNAIKYSEAETIWIKLRSSGNSKLFVVVSDNGKGFEIEEKMVTGLGLRNLESRTQIIDAKFKLKSRIGYGTTAIICMKTVGM